MKAIGLTLLLCLLNLLLSAQSEMTLMNGWIKPLEGDTIYTKIEYLNWDQNPGAIRFLSGGGLKEVSPLEIQSFMVAGEHYLSYIGQVIDRPYKVTDLERSPGISYRQDTVFLKYRLAGSRSLLTYKDRNSKTHLFYQLRRESPVELEYYQYMVSLVENRVTVKDAGTFKGQLAVILAGCEEIPRRFRGLRYDFHEVAKLFKMYFECKGETLSHEAEKSKYRPGIGLSAGITFLSYAMESDVFPRLEELAYQGKWSPKFGIWHELYIPRTNRRFSILNELHYLSHSYQGSGSYPTQNFGEEYTYTIDSEYFRFVTGFRGSKWQEENSRLFAEFGFSFNFGTHDSYQRVRRYDLDDMLTYDQTSEIVPSVGFNPTVLFGIGYQKGPLGFIGRYEYGFNGFTTVATVGSASSRVDVLVAFKLIN